MTVGGISHHSIAYHHMHAWQDELDGIALQTQRKTADPDASLTPRHATLPGQLNP